MKVKVLLLDRTRARVGLPLAGSVWILDFVRKDFATQVQVILRVCILKLAQ